MEEIFAGVRSSIASIGAYRSWIIALIWLLIFLIAALISLMVMRRRSLAPKAPVAARIDDGLDPVEAKRQALRARHQVRPLRQLEDGFGFGKLPDGAYGFTMLPASRDSPVLRTKQPGLFEIHKTPEGSMLIVGFTSSATAAAMATQRVRAPLFAEPVTEAPILVSIPVSSVLRFVSRDRNAVEVEVEPADSERPLYGKPPGTAASDAAAKARSA
jgi:hypothetical protein